VHAGVIAKLYIDPLSFWSTLSHLNPVSFSDYISMADYDPDVVDEAEEGEEDELQVRVHTCQSALASSSFCC
jgi:hypothetical protein